jgi:hypothetical protein
MFRNPRSSAVCLSLVVGFFMSAPWGRRLPLNSSIYAFLTHAEQGDSSESLKPEKGTVCTGTPQVAEGIVLNSSRSHSNPFLNQGPFLEKDRKQAVLALIRYPWEDLGFSIVFMGSRLGYRAMTLTARRRIEVYARPGDGLIQQAYDLAHELGHAYDLKNNNEERRLKWRELRGIDSSIPWFGCDACPDYATPAGDFAETFAFLLLGPGNFHSVMAPVPTASRIPELAAFCHIEHLSESFNVHVSKENKTPRIAEEDSSKGVPAQNLPEFPQSDSVATITR